MEKIRELVNKPLVAAGLGFVLGLIIGLPILGWGLMPVKWTDAGPQQLREDLQKDYMRMSIESYGINSDDAKAKARWDEFGAQAEEVFNSVLADPSVNPDWAARFINAAQGSVSAIEPNVEAETPVVGEAEASVPAEGETGHQPSNVTGNILRIDIDHWWCSGLYFSTEKAETRCKWFFSDAAGQ